MIVASNLYACTKSRTKKMAQTVGLYAFTHIRESCLRTCMRVCACACMCVREVRTCVYAYKRRRAAGVVCTRACTSVYFSSYKKEKSCLWKA